MAILVLIISSYELFSMMNLHTLKLAAEKYSPMSEMCCLSLLNPPGGYSKIQKNKLQILEVNTNLLHFRVNNLHYSMGSKTLTLE